MIAYSKQYLCTSLTADVNLIGLYQICLSVLILF